ncbi:MAG: hypothetical protein M1479_01655 [Actinobacteria bacterium]|nr:hypothetical protein [Actinomycetota bacterium]
MIETINDKKTNNNKKYVIGLDFGTDSVRALVGNVDTGKEEAIHVSYYKRWGQGKFIRTCSYNKIIKDLLINHLLLQSINKTK